MKILVLVTTMNQKDEGRYKEMNLQTDAIIANQSDEEWVKNYHIDGHDVKLVTTKTRGLSKNRNIALDNIWNCDVIIFSDDDLIFYDCYEKMVIKEFRDHPKADAIRFNLNCISNRKLFMKPIERFHKSNRREVASWGICGAAFKAVVLKESGIRFNEKFGAGTDNYCGEDSIFLQEILKKGIKLFASPQIIADINQEKSSWFDGFTEKYFYTGGKILAATYPYIAYLLAIRSAYKFWKRKTDFGFFTILKLYFKGISSYLSERI